MAYSKRDQLIRDLEDSLVAGTDVGSVSDRLYLWLLDQLSASPVGNSISDLLLQADDADLMLGGNPVTLLTIQ